MSDESVKEPSKVGIWFAGFFLVIMLSIFALAVLTFIYYSCVTIDTNLSISNLSGWEYKGEGSPSIYRSYYFMDCYGNQISVADPNRIGNIVVDADRVYTPVSFWCGWKTLPFNGRYHGDEQLRRDSSYLLYEKKYWFNSNYLVICK